MRAQFLSVCLAYASPVPGILDPLFPLLPTLFTNRSCRSPTTLRTSTVSQETPSQSCQTSIFEPTIPDTDLGYHELTNLKEFQDFFEASIKRAEALVQLSKTAKQGPYL